MMASLNVDVAVGRNVGCETTFAEDGSCRRPVFRVMSTSHVVAAM
jgi:hypothetical protein